MKSIFYQSVHLNDAPALQALYASSPRYFQTIAADIPSLEDVQHELETALSDIRRQLEFVLLDDTIVGYLDLKHDYPRPGDVTVNLLLIADTHQRCGLGTLVMRDLERRLRGSASQLLAGVFGENPGAARFWEGLGYHFAVDAGPVLSWYAKDLPLLQLETMH